MQSSWKLFIALGFAGVAAAQTPAISVGGIVNVASYAYAGLPSGGIAPGSMFVAFGSNMGPAVLAQATSFPLPTVLGGTSVKVTAGGSSYDAILNYTSAAQITAILPSAVPPGTATMTVTYNGATSAPQTFTVSANSFGTFAANAGGSGPGAITNAAGKVLTATLSVNPNKPAVIYGTGIGAITGNDAALPTVADMTGVPVEVYVGNTRAAVTYRGRTSCCAGVDQVNFTVPSVAGLTGCAVPVTVKINNVISNNTTIPISAAGTRTCSDPGGPTSSLLESISAKGNVTIGGVALTRITTSITLPFPVPGFDPNFSADVGAASFVSYTQTQLNGTASPFNTQTIGTCTVSWARGGAVAPAAPSLLPKFLDAGTAIKVTGPGGVQSLTKSAGSLGYAGLFGGLTGSSTYLDAGTFTIAGPGGPDIGAFTAVLKVPTSVTWTNRDSIVAVTRSAGQVITWSGGDASTTVLIGGTSTNGTGNTSIGGNFQCSAKATDGTFTIPAQVLLSLPTSTAVSGIDGGALYVAANTAPVLFNASGLDYGVAIGVVESLKTMGYK